MLTKNNSTNFSFNFKSVLILLFILLLSTNLLYSQTSFIKIAVSEEGFYRLDSDILSSLNIDPGVINPQTVKLYNNGGSELPQNLSTERSHDWLENAVYIYNPGNDGFDADDYILFYGRPVCRKEINPEIGEYSHYTHPYANENIYWLLPDGGSPGKRMAEIPVADGSGLTPEAAFQDFIFADEDSLNPIRTGLTWFAATLMEGESYETVFDLPGVANSGTAQLKFRGQYISSVYHEIQINLNEQSFNTEPGFGGGALVQTIDVTNSLKAGENNLKFNLTGGSSFYLDWWELTFPRPFEADQNFLNFYSPTSAGIYRYQISNFSSNEIFLFDVSEFESVKLLTGARIQEGTIDFVAENSDGKVKQYWAISPEAFLIPKNTEMVEIVDLKNTAISADYLIITHDDFYDAALRLAEYRSTQDNLASVVIGIADIYASFACGLPDPTAIRDFLKFTWENSTPRPQFVLLFGDGDYDYRNILYQSDKNWIPPFITDEFNDTNSRAVDDWFVAFSNSDSHILPELAIGRIPVRTSQEAWTVVDKIIQYESGAERFGNWRNRITVVADDEYDQGGDIVAWNYIHTVDAEELAANFEEQNFQVEKIYSVDFAPVNVDTLPGYIKPQVQDIIVKKINQGSLIMNYVGHANEKKWAHESIFEADVDIPRLCNSRFPLFWAASCRYGRFDLVQTQGMAEQLLTAEEKGAIGIIAGTRDTFATLNSRINRSFYENLFSSVTPGLRVGQALAQAKHAVPDVNSQKYVLLGDPALRLALPELAAEITKMTPSNFQAGDVVLFRGNVLRNGQLAADFNGKAYVQSFDAQVAKNVTHAEQSFSVDYKLTGNPLFRGTSPVENGEFVARFFVPRNVADDGKDARICVYFWNDETDGHGTKNDIHIQNDGEFEDDVTGPAIALSFNDDEQNRRTPSLSPTLFISMDDWHGINITGDSTCKITLMLNDDPETETDLTEYFTYNSGSCTTGKIIYVLDEMAAGTHKFTVKAFDNYNNLTVKDLDMVVGIDEPALANLPNSYVLHQNYPNPFNSATQIRYALPEPENVQIKIFNLLGKEVTSLVNTEQSAGEHHVTWDGTDAAGTTTASGVYLLRMQAGEFQEVKRVVVLR